MSDTPYYRDHYYQSLLKAVRANPADDLPRLVMADWLDENKQPERAAWVRHHVRGDALPPFFLDSSPDLEWLPAIDGYTRVELPAAIEYLPSGRAADGPVRVAFARGFVSRVSGPLLTLVGDQCRVCGGVGDTLVQTDYGVTQERCLTCHGTGRTPGILADLLAREPIGPEGIEVTDCEPLDNAGFNTDADPDPATNFANRWWWLRQQGDRRMRWELPDEVFVRLESSEFGYEEKPRAALSRALFDLHAPAPPRRMWDDDRRTGRRNNPTCRPTHTGQYLLVVRQL